MLSPQPSHCRCRTEIVASMVLRTLNKKKQHSSFLFCFIIYIHSGCWQKTRKSNLDSQWARRQVAHVHELTVLAFYIAAMVLSTWKKKPIKFTFLLRFLMVLVWLISKLFTRSCDAHFCRPAPTYVMRNTLQLTSNQCNSLRFYLNALRHSLFCQKLFDG